MAKVSRIRFQRKVSIQTWDFRLSIQKFEEHPVWLAILKLASENNGRASLKMVQEKLLVDKLPKLNAKILLSRVISEGLLNEDYRLTEDGREAVREERVPVQMSGFFTTSFVDDPLIPQIVLSISEPHRPRVSMKDLRFDGPARREIENAQEGPEFLPDIIDRHLLVNEEMETIVIKNVERFGTPKKSKMADLILEFTSQNIASLKLEGPLKRELPLPDDFDFDFNKSLDVLLQEFGKDWKKDSEKVLVSYKNTEEADRRRFRKTFKIPKPELPGYGAFESVTTPKIRIEPKSQADCQAWFDWLLVDELPDQYLQASKYLEFVKKTREKFPSRFQIEEPLQENLAMELFERGMTPKAWRLQAPLDLSMGDAP